MILKEIGKMGLKIMNGEGNEIIITPAEFTLFWKRVGEFTEIQDDVSVEMIPVCFC